MKRRDFIKAVSSTGLVSMALTSSDRAWGYDSASGKVPSVVSVPPRKWDIRDPLNYTPDPDILVIQPEFASLINGNSAIHRVYNGAGWLEGPAWSSQGRFLLLSDTVKSCYYRYLWESGEVTVFPLRSYNGNGNAFDFQGRLLCCEHFLRRVVRWENDGSMTILADSFEGKPLNSPNDVIAHPDGSVWFTDPSYGDLIDEGHADEPGGQANPRGEIRYKVGVELPARTLGMRRGNDHTFRIDPSGHVTSVITENEIRNPNGLAFSPDYKRLYVASTGSPKASFHHDGDKAVHVFDVKEGGKLANHRIFNKMCYGVLQAYADGIKCDVQGNLWCGVSGPLGWGGVHVFNSKGEMIGRIRLPQSVSNLTFGGPKRNWLFMCAGEDLYRLMVSTQGLAPS